MYDGYAIKQQKQSTLKRYKKQNIEDPKRVETLRYLKKHKTPQEGAKHEK